MRGASAGGGVRCGPSVAGRAHAAEPHVSQPRAPGRVRCELPRACGPDPDARPPVNLRTVRGWSRSSPRPLNPLFDCGPCVLLAQFPAPLAGSVLTHIGHFSPSGV
ncbi:hypothetical protein GCM10010289_61260 [Streptomyces violascens]|uniref:Uncharacterized protein n=1 Tax=Streptomyces violascens TaxID=67381 RepID=A0ABQ3R2F3_9ACTN|nr:hypothetical protein GCM10010289_61260 [Streptomyces violascens]GHI43680.1 hypothetical protein Sviol_80880 [Streptomyces violascens]